jgi:hypothetical protein
MLKWIITMLVLASWTAGVQARSLVLDCAVPATTAASGHASALVKRDMHSVTVETEQWVGTWQIQPQREQGFRAVLASAEVKPGNSHSREKRLLQDLQTLAINMTGPQGGFQAGKRYSCAMSDQQIARL